MKTRKPWMQQLKEALDKSPWLPVAQPHTDPGIAWLYMRLPDESNGANETNGIDTPSNATKT